jgi:hypothetical protein
MSESEISRPDEGGRELSFHERVEHLKSGYDNSQAVVRFLDAKASAVIAAIPVVIAALAALFSIIKEWVRWKEAFASTGATWLWTVAVLCGVAGAILLVVAVLAITAAFSAIKPRDPGTAKPSMLFPFAATYQLPTPDDSFASRMLFFKTNADRSHVLEDYERQMVRMSEIVATKLACVNQSVEYLKAFFVVAAALLALLLLLTLLAAALGAPS